MTLEQKIQRVEDHVLRKQLYIAQLLASEFRNENSPSPLKHSGFPILQIGMAYFEMIAQLTTGESSDGKSTQSFIQGFRFVYPQTPLSDERIKNIYRCVRCGLYHIGSTKVTVDLSRYYTEGFSVLEDRIRINPAILIDDMVGNFNSYLCDLRDETNVTLRSNFLTIWNLMSAPSNVSGSSTTAESPKTPSLWENCILDEECNPPTTTQGGTPTVGIWDDCTFLSSEDQ